MFLEDKSEREEKELIAALTNRKKSSSHGRIIEFAKIGAPYRSHKRF
jgi:hypothetical protein